MAYEKVGRVTDASVKKGTGKGWAQWIAILSKAGAKAWSHREIVAYLWKTYKLTPWWQQGVTHGFEVATGRREDGQNQKGKYTLTVTKSLPFDAKKTWKWITSPQGIDAWLKASTPFKIKPGEHFETRDGYFGELRTMLTGVRMRLRWQEPEWEKSTFMQVFVVARGNGKAILVFNHDDIATAKLKAELRKRWQTSMNDLMAIAPSADPALQNRAKRK